MRYFHAIVSVAAIILAIWLPLGEAVSPIPPPGWCPPGFGRSNFYDFTIQADKVDIEHFFTFF